jgi:hypothetical protein
LDEIMIARLWTGTTRAADADAYQEYVREVAPPGHANVTGNCAVPMPRQVRSQNHSSPRATATSTAIMAWPRSFRPVAHSPRRSAQRAQIRIIGADPAKITISASTVPSRQGGNPIAISGCPCCARMICVRPQA